MKLDIRDLEQFFVIFVLMSLIMVAFFDFLSVIRKYWSDVLSYSVF
jgi:cell shape-determining protein MreC